jgi:hypothetical protein
VPLGAALLHLAQHDPAALARVTCQLLAGMSARGERWVVRRASACRSS